MLGWVLSLTLTDRLLSQSSTLTTDNKPEKKVNRTISKSDQLHVESDSGNVAGEGGCFGAQERPLCGEDH